MNDGQCIQGGEGEGASPFIHFHCKCVHPYKGILCDVSCDTDSKFNFQLLCFTWYCLWDCVFHIVRFTCMSSFFKLFRYPSSTNEYICFLTQSSWIWRDIPWFFVVNSVEHKRPFHLPPWWHSVITYYTAEVNGIAIGILAGVLGLVLIGIAWSATSNWRRWVCKYRKNSDPHHSRKKGCWETLFGWEM